MGILNVFEDDFFENSDIKSRPKPGDIYFVPITETPETQRVLEVGRSSPNDHSQINFVQKDIDLSTHFKEARNLPIKSFKLETGEELVALKAKLRPVVVIKEAVVNNIDFLPGSERKKSEHLTRSSFLVVPAYSVSTMIKPTSFHSILVGKIRKMEYPQFFCLPDETQPLIARSVLRLDRSHWVCLGKDCRKHNKRLNEELLKVLSEQWNFLINGIEGAAYKLVKDLVSEVIIEE